MKPPPAWLIVFLAAATAAVAGWKLGQTQSSVMLDFVVALSITVVFSRWIDILRRHK